MAVTSSNPDLLTFAAQIVSAHVSHNAVSPEALPAVIQSVFDTLSGLGTEAVPIGKPRPAVPINKSVFPDHIVCLEDGKKLKMLKRHLKTSYGMTPEQYRERWGLPPSYPMAPPNYAAHRSALAKHAGLGRRPAIPEEPASEGEPPTAAIHRVPEGVRGKRASRKKGG
jgi:predicted transcriptional regulator